MCSVPTVAKVVSGRFSRHQGKESYSRVSQSWAQCCFCPVPFGPFGMPNKARNFKRAADAEALSWYCWLVSARHLKMCFQKGGSSAPSLTDC